MQLTTINQATLEELYAHIILPQFGLTKRHILWLEHRAIGPDSDAHEFLCDDEHLILVFDDYPATTISDVQEEFAYKSAIEQVSLASDAKGAVEVDISTSKAEDSTTLRFGPGATPFIYVHNVTGYFRLFRLAVPPEDVRLHRMKIRRQNLRRKSAAYTSLIDIGYEMLALGKNVMTWDHIAHMAQSSSTLARNHGFNDLENFFFDVAEEADCYKDISDMTHEEYLHQLKQKLRTLASDAHINPGVTAAEKHLLDACALPIHTKMMQQPQESMKYFVELVELLDTFVKRGELTETAAAEELSHTLDRPQIVNSHRLRSAVLLAYELELPHTLRRQSPAKKWNHFTEEIYAAVKRR
jgi:hypothetical protein